MSLYRIVMQLARNPGHPEGDAGQGYVIIAPLDADNRLDLEEWREHKSACTVVRFNHGGLDDADGWLTHNGTHWYFHYDEPEEGADEPVFRLGDHRLGFGDYVSIRSGEGDALTYRITQRNRYGAPETDKPRPAAKETAK